MADIIDVTDLNEVTELRKKALSKNGKARASSLDERRRAETAAQRTGDGRVRMAATDVDGRVQLNGRVMPDVKNQVIEAAQSAGVDMSSVIEAALETFFKNPDWVAVSANYTTRKTRKRS